MIVKGGKMYNSIVQAQCVTLRELNHLFLNLEYNKSVSKNISIYRSRSFNHKNKNYLQIEDIKDALKNIDRSTLKYIYVTGKDCISHPDFNSILRLCLQYTPVTIYSDGTCLNDKKARFLKRVEDEGTNEIIFKIFINHFDERTNDEKAGRGAFRKAIHAVTSLNKYGFNPILVIKNSTNSGDSELIDGFRELGKKFKFDTEDINLQLIPDLKSETESVQQAPDDFEPDCMTGRLLTKNGVYTCPVLANDYRGRSGSNITNFSKKCYLETSECQHCRAYGKKLFTNNWL